MTPARGVPSGRHRKNAPGGLPGPPDVTTHNRPRHTSAGRTQQLIHKGATTMATTLATNLILLAIAIILALGLLRRP